MGASFSDRFYIAAPQGVAAKLSSMLLAAQTMPSGVVHTGVEAVRAAQGGAFKAPFLQLAEFCSFGAKHS